MDYLACWASWPQEFSFTITVPIIYLQDSSVLRCLYSQNLLWLRGDQTNHIMKKTKTEIRITANDEMKNISLLAKLLYMVWALK